MRSGSQELGWRIHEAAPDDIAAVYTGLVRPYGESPSARDLLRMGMVAEYLDVFDIIRSDSTEQLTAPREASKPLPDLTDTRPELPYSHLADERIVCVGAGAGSLLVASYLCRRGVPPENITTIDPREQRGGIWTEDWVRFGGYNNPAPLHFDVRNTIFPGQRKGPRMHEYLDGIAGHYLYGSNSVQGSVVDMQRERKGDREWVVRTDDGDAFEATSVLLATGRPHPRRIDSGRIASNLDDIERKISSDELIVERFQRRLEDTELASGRPIVLIGLGNSTAAMLNQIHEYEDRTGNNVNYAVLTDKSEEAVQNPQLSIDGKSIYRLPKFGYLTGYSGDIPRDRDAYERARDRWRIASGVSSIHYDQDKHVLRVADDMGYRDFADAHVFALIGYDRDDQLFRAAGALSRGWLRDLFGKGLKTPEIRAADGAVHTHTDGYMSNVYAVGAAAATPGNPNAAVIPGIQAQAPRTTLTIAVRNAARRRAESVKP